MLAQVDPTPNTVAGGGASDWASLLERMHYIADLLRFYHQAPELFSPAFTPEQAEAIIHEKLPPEKL